MNFSQFYLTYARFPLYHAGIINEHGAIIDQDLLEKVFVDFTESVEKYTLNFDEFITLEKYISTNKDSIQRKHNIGEELYNDINCVMNVDLARAMQGINKDVKFQYYFLSGFVWDKIRKIIDSMRNDDFKQKFKSDK